MSDVAVLGIQVDSSQVTKATSALTALGAAAAPAATSTTATTAAVNSLNTAAGAAATSASALANASKTLPGSAAPAAAAVTALGAATAAASKTSAQHTAQVGLERYELINLSRQAQDVAVSLQGGQSPLTVLAQQGSQIADVFISSKGSIGGFLSQLASGFGSVFTAGRLVVGGIAAIGIGAIAAATSWQGAQRDVSLAMMGIGRASLVTAGDINKIAESASSLKGLSISEARETATALAATGKIGVDNIEALTGQTRNFAAVLGMDVPKAAAALGTIFANPTEGAKQLAARIGGIDASTLKYIETLETQGDRQAAIKVLFDAVAPAIQGAADKSGTLSKSWNFLGNAASDLYTKVGKGISQLGTGGLSEQTTADLEKQRVALEALLKTYESANISDGLGGGEVSAIKTQLQAVNDELTKIAASRKAALGVQADDRSIGLGSLATSLAPANDSLRELTAQSKALNDALTDPALEAFRAKLGDQLPLAAARAKSAIDGLKANVDLADPIKSSIQALTIQNQLLTDGSPVMRRRVADQLAYNDAIKQRATPDEATAIGKLRGDQAYGGTATDISQMQARISLLGQMASAEDAAKGADLARQSAALQGVRITDAQAANLRRLAIEQNLGITAIKASTDAQRTESATIGMSVGDATAYAAAQNAINEAKRAGRPLTDANIAAIQNEASALGAAASRTDLLRSAYDGLVRGPLQTLQSSIANGSTFFDALKKSGVSALNALSSKLMDMAAQNLFKSAFGGSSGGGGLLSLLGLGGGELAGWGTSSFIGPTINHTGYGPGDPAGPTRYVHPAYFDNAPRFHSGIGPGERPAIIRNDESVLTPGQMSQLATVDSASGGAQKLHVTVGLSVDDDGKLTAHVKDVSQQSVQSYARSTEFEMRAHAASVKGDRNRWSQ